MMVMMTIMINMRMMIVSTDMIEKYDRVTWHCVALALRALAECRMQKGSSKTRN